MPASQPLRFGRPPVERTLRIFTGLVLFTFAGCHFINHACGIFGLDVMEAVRKVLIWPWRTYPGLALLYGSFFVHAALGLYAFYRRRHFRIPKRELLQIMLGLAIPPLIMVHAANVRLGDFLFGLEESYPRIVYRYWTFSPAAGLTRQFCLLLILWTHGCLGLYSFLRFRSWFAAWAPALAAAAALIPVLAVIGIADGGRDLDRHVAIAGFVEAANAQTPAQTEALNAIGQRFILAYLAIVAAVFLLHGLRGWRERRFSAVKIRYPHGRRAVVPRGFSILEASRWAGIDHTSICGGRGRCSTCRVLVTAGLGRLPRPNAAETNTLAWIGAYKGVRLACQVRPRGDLAVVPLLSRQGGDAAKLAAPFAASDEVEIVALFVDLRNSTRLADGRLPYDALYVIDRYVGAVTYAVAANGGRVTSVAGDGVMCVFGWNTDARTACKRAIRALAEIWRLLGALHEECQRAFNFPLRFGAGCHVGLAVVGELLSRREFQFVGEVGNVAARLEGLTKELGCPILLSRSVIERAGIAARAPDFRRSSIRGPANEIELAAFQTRSELQVLVLALEESAPRRKRGGRPARRPFSGRGF